MHANCSVETLVLALVPMHVQELVELHVTKDQLNNQLFKNGTN